MSNSVEKQNLLMWFSYLHALQSACSFNTSVKTMDLLTFANANIVQILPSANEQSQFILNVKTSPGFDVSTNDLSTYATFEALLDHFNPLPTYVGAYLQTLSAGTLPSGSLADFLSAAISAAFPGGSTGASWKTAVSMLTSVIPAVCFSAKLQAAAATTVDDPSKKVSDLVNQIATLG
jgi:hypothetical protein